MIKSKKQEFQDSERTVLRISIGQSRDRRCILSDDLFVSPKYISSNTHMLTTNVCKALKALCSKGLMKKSSRGKYTVTRKGYNYDTGN